MFFLFVLLCLFMVILLSFRLLNFVMSFFFLFMFSMMVIFILVVSFFSVFSRGIYMLGFAFLLRFMMLLGFLFTFFMMLLFGFCLFLRLLMMLLLLIFCFFLFMLCLMFLLRFGIMLIILIFLLMLIIHQKRSRVFLSTWIFIIWVVFNFFLTFVGWIRAKLAWAAILSTFMGTYSLSLCVLFQVTPIFIVLDKWNDSSSRTRDIGEVAKLKFGEK